MRSVSGATGPMSRGAPSLGRRVSFNSTQGKQMYLWDVNAIEKIKSEAKRKRNAETAMAKIESSLRSYECFFKWPALFDSFRKDIERLKRLK